MQFAFQIVLRIAKQFTSLFSNLWKYTTQLQMNKTQTIKLNADHSVAEGHHKGNFHSKQELKVLIIVNLPFSVKV